MDPRDETLTRVKTALRQPTDATDLELLEGWFRAEADAREAYALWTRRRDRDSYAVYRACADRADAAQDELGRWERWTWADGRRPRHGRGARAAEC